MLRVLLTKELLDVLRDRRTLVMTLVVPVLLYPGALAAMGALIASGMDRLRQEPLVVAVTSDDGQRLLGAPPPYTTFVRQPRAEAEAALRDQKLAAVVDVPAGAVAALDDGAQVTATVLYTRRFDRSSEALDRIRPLLEEANHKALVMRLELRGLDAGFATPVVLSSVDLDFEKDLWTLMASKLLPVVLLTMLFLGALYPAIELIAGEKERGTLETLLVCPVRPTQVMAAKYLTVGVVSVTSTVVNLGATAITFGAGVSLAGDEVRSTMHFSAGQLGALLACLLSAAFLVSGLAVAVASMARSYKEGQSMMTPVMLLGLAPALVAQMPGMELTWVTALVPLLNVALLVKAVVLGTATASTVVLTVASVLVCGGLALWAAAVAFNSEVFRFGGMPGWLRPLVGRRGG